MTIEEQIRVKKAEANLAWDKYCLAAGNAARGATEVARLRERIHTSNDQELLEQIASYATLKRRQDAQVQLEAELQLAAQESDEIERHLGELLVSRDAIGQVTENRK